MTALLSFTPHGSLDQIANDLQIESGIGKSDFLIITPEGDVWNPDTRGPDETVEPSMGAGVVGMMVGSDPVGGPGPAVGPYLPGDNVVPVIPSPVRPDPAPKYHQTLKDFQVDQSLVDACGDELAKGHHLLALQSGRGKHPTDAKDLLVAHGADVHWVGGE